MRVKLFMTGLLALFLGFVLTGCAGISTRGSVDITCISKDADAMLKSGEYRKKVDNFLVLMDSSSSMGETLVGPIHREPTKLLLAKELTSCISNSLPDDFDVNAGIRIFGPEYFGKDLVYGMSKFSKADMEKGIDVASASGLTPLGDAITAASKDLQGLPGKTAVIILSDGLNTVKSNPVAAATALKEKYRENICFYTIHVGNEANGRMTLENVTAAGECGFAAEADNLHTRTLSETSGPVELTDGMSDFVTAIFLEKSPKAPKKAPPKKVDRDSDGDGVLDSMDKCPNTPKGIKVDKDGCPVPIPEKVSITLLVQFDFDKVDVKPQYHDDIAKVAGFLQAYPKTTGVLEGHTDSIGTEQYNQRLSERRAESVKKYLVEKFDIDGSRLTTVGYGEAKPVASNATDAGRYRNRRVVANIVSIVVK